jgi:hypothetical protein
MQTFATPAPITAVLDIPAGRVQFIAADRADTVVDVRPANASKTRDAKTAEHTTVTYADGVLHVTAGAVGNRYLGASGALEVTVQLPTGSRVQAKAASTELRGVGRLGDVDFDGAFRQIKIDEAASLRLTAVDGDVQVGRLNGPARITTARGDITVTEATRGTLDLRTQSGSITVGAVPGTSASLDAATHHGRVSNSLKNNGTTDLSIHATTNHGDITARGL